MWKLDWEREVVEKMVSFMSISPPPPSTFYYGSRYLAASLPPLPRSTPSSSEFKKMVVVLPLKCLSDSTQNTQSEANKSSSPPPPTPTPTPNQSSISTYNLCAAIGSLGFLETGYLTYLKLTGSDIFCPIGGGNCGDILNSDYASVFGVPLPIFGMAAYGLVASLGVHLGGKNILFGLSDTYGRTMLLATTTSMAAASAYFIYILSTEFAGASCSYCLLSATLSFTLFFTILKDLGLQEIQKVVGLQLCIAGLVVAALNTSYSSSQPVPVNFGDVNLPYYKTEIVKESSPLALSLAKHLHSIGAKMYGAFWCSHCLEQKQMFGREAAEILDYVECFPDGFKKGTKMVQACSDAGLEGFPTWVINGKVLSGEKELSELALLSGFVPEDSNPT